MYVMFNYFIFGYKDFYNTGIVCVNRSTYICIPFVWLDGADALLVYLEYWGFVFLGHYIYFLMRRCKGNLIVHIMMCDQLICRDEKGGQHST